MARKMTALGAVAVLIYISHVIIGGLLWEEYSHLHRPISDLTASGAPNRMFLSVLTVFYGILSVLFSLGAYLILKNNAPRASQIGMLVFLSMHIISLFYNFFPQDLPGDSLTFRGLMHIVITILIIPLTIISPILVGLGLRKLKDFQLYSYFSLLTGLVIFLSGAAVAVFIANDWPYFGILQRINIGSLQIWMLATSLKLVSIESQTRKGQSKKLIY